MSELIESIERRQLRTDLPRFRVGDRVRVHFQVIEGNRRRTQVFEGAVIRLQGSGSRKTFTVRKVSFGIGVERTFPVHSPKIERLEVVARGDVRRAKLYYLRGRIGRRARVRERRDFAREEPIAPGVTAGAPAAPEPSADGADAVAKETAAESDVVAEAEAAETAAAPEASEADGAEPPEPTAVARQAAEPEAPEAEAPEAEAAEPEAVEPEAAPDGERADVEEKS